MKFVDLNVSGCPNTCRHCARDGHPPYGGLFSLDEIRAIRDEWGPLITHCYEPTAHPDFPDLYDHETTVDPGGHVVTNGFGLARREDYAAVFERMHEIGVHTLWFTLHGLRDHHDWFVRREGAFDDIVRATRRSREAGFRATWQVYVDSRGLDDVSALVELALKECGQAPNNLDVPYHRVGRRLWQYERFRPVLKDILDRKLHELMDDPRKNRLMNPKSLTAAAWLEKWRQSPEADDFRHPFEPPTWPPQRSFEMLDVYIQPDRKVYFDPICAPPILLGTLSEGKDVLLQRLETTQPPKYLDVDPDTVDLSLAEQEQLHPTGYSVRYKAISKAHFAESGAL